MTHLTLELTSTSRDVLAGALREAVEYWTAKSDANYGPVARAYRTAATEMRDVQRHVNMSGAERIRLNLKQLEALDEALRVAPSRLSDDGSINALQATLTDYVKVVL